MSKSYDPGALLAISLTTVTTATFNFMLGDSLSHQHFHPQTNSFSIQATSINLRSIQALKILITVYGVWQKRLSWIIPFLILYAGLIIECLAIVVFIVAGASISSPFYLTSYRLLGDRLIL